MEKEVNYECQINFSSSLNEILRLKLITENKF